MKGSMYFLTALVVTVVCMAGVFFINDDWVVIGLIPALAVGIFREIYEYSHPEKFNASFSEMFLYFLGVIIGSLAFVTVFGMIFYPNV